MERPALLRRLCGYFGLRSISPCPASNPLAGRASPALRAGAVQVQIDMYVFASIVCLYDLCIWGVYLVPELCS